MTTRSDPPGSDKEFWQSLAPGNGAQPSLVDAMTFAAWIDGRLGDAETAQVEAAMAADPETRRAALDIADILSKPLPAVPERMIVRAQALADFAVERRSVRDGFWRRWMRKWLPATGPAWQHAAMTMAVVVIAAGGLSMGGGLGTSFVQGRLGSVDNQKVATAFETSSDINEFFGSDGI